MMLHSYQNFCGLVVMMPAFRTEDWGLIQRYTDRVLQTIQMKLTLLWVWAEWAVLGRAKTALKFKYEI